MIHTKRRTLARIEAEYRALDRAVRRLAPADFRRPAFQAEARERWTVKDALAHIVWWKANMHRAITKAPQRPGWSKLTVRQANKKIYDEWHRTSPRELVAWHRAAHRALLASLRRLPEVYFSGRRRSGEWPFDLVGHSAEHRTRHIERAVERGR